MSKDGGEIKARFRRKPPEIRGLAEAIRVVQGGNDPGYGGAEHSEVLRPGDTAGPGGVGETEDRTYNDD